MSYQPTIMHFQYYTGALHPN